MFSMGKKLRASGDKSEEEIKKILADERNKLFSDLRNKEDVDLKNSHQAALAKQKHMDKLKSALKIRNDFQDGAAFDIELQERKRKERLEEKERLKKEEKKARKQAKKD